VLPTLRVEGLQAASGDQPDHGLACAATENAADLRDWDASDFARYARGIWSGKQELIVFAAVKSLLKRGRGMDGQGGSRYFGGDAGLLAEMREIGGETIAEVDGCGCTRRLREPEALRDAGLRVEVRLEHRLETGGNAQRHLMCAGSAMCRRRLHKAGKSSGGASEAARDIEQIAGARSGTEERFSAPHCAGEDNVGDDDGRFREVATSQRGLMRRSERKKSIEKEVKPGLTPFCFLEEIARQTK